MNEVEIQSLTVRGDGLVEIHYMEPREQTQNVGIVRVLIFDREASSLVEELINDAREVVDEMLTKLNEPPAFRPSGL